MLPRWPRRVFKKALFRFIQKIAGTEDARAIAYNALQGLLQWDPRATLQSDALFLPYAELGPSQLAKQPSQRSDVIIITARFRSGSTLLWNLFRHLEGITAYYEPFNERRWFDPQARGDIMDATHRNVGDNYWDEYNGLDILHQYYREEWINKNLFMDPAFWEPGMKRYVEILIEKAPGRPVLQFNRIDFRLPWFRQNFPAATIVHLYRHPREQWCSFLLDPTCFPRTGRMDQFPPHDKFYLRWWAQDLKYHFPFLDEQTLEHPYQMFYYIWKLSYIFGVNFAHYSIAFEHLLADPQAHLEKLFCMLNIKDYNIDTLTSLVTEMPAIKWTYYADDAWFRRYETICETVLADFFSNFKKSARTVAVL
jgi:hypothetical protein